MNSIPDGVVQHILSNLSNARDILSCASVSRLFRDAVPFLPALFFPRSLFDGIPRAEADAAISHMILSAQRLEHLVIYCPFSASALAAALSLRRQSLRHLELRMDSSAADKILGSSAAATRVNAIGVVVNLEELKLWGVSLAQPPKWDGFHRLRSLEIVGAAVRDDALDGAIRACPNLAELALLGCDGGSSISIELLRLEKCRLDFLGPADCSLYLSSPELRVLEIQGFAWIRVNEKHSLKSLSIAKNSGNVYRIDVGRLPGLDYLSLRGVQWSWRAISSILHCASEVKNLLMKIEFTGDVDTLQPFPQVDLVEFFNGHQKLHKFEIHGAMFAALCQKSSLKNVDLSFIIPCLEEVIVTVRSPLNAEQKLSTLRSLAEHSPKLRKMVIRISRMRNCNETADDFFKEICKFKRSSGEIVRIE